MAVRTIDKQRFYVAVIDWHRAKSGKNSESLKVRKFWHEIMLSANAKLSELQDVARVCTR